MRALWLVRPDLELDPGGDTTQIMETAAILRRRGVKVDLSSTRKPNLRDYDIVHLFHLDRVWENVNWCSQIRAAGVPAVLSPIYWPTDEFDQRGRPGLRGAIGRWGGTGTYHNLKLIHRTGMNTITRRDPHLIKFAAFGYERSRRYVLESVKALLPNSIAEREQLEHRFGTKGSMVVVPNAGNGRAFSPTAELAASNTDREDGSVLCVGRIEPRKNQLTLIRAQKNSGWRLRIVGRTGQFSHSYARQCRREAGPGVEFLDWRSPEELHRWYRASGVHVSASWYETPGLASLEAASYGCPIVVTPGGSTREYFANNAEYCAPADPGSIQRAVKRVLARPKSTGRACRKFTWDDAAHKTLEAYEYAAKSAKSSDSTLT